MVSCRYYTIQAEPFMGWGGERLFHFGIKSAVAAYPRGDLPLMFQEGLLKYEWMHFTPGFNGLHILYALLCRFCVKLFLLVSFYPPPTPP